MKVKFIHATRENAETLDEAVAIVDATDKTPDCDFFQCGFEISGKKIVDIELPDIFPFNETWIKLQHL